VNGSLTVNGARRRRPSKRASARPPYGWGMQMPNLLAVATIPVGFIASAAWSAFIVFELFKLTLLLLSNI